VTFWYALRLAGVGAQVDDYGQVFQNKTKKQIEGVEVFAPNRFGGKQP
jgi:hypothetical protein